MVPNPNAHFDRAPVLSANDARHLGRLAALDVAVPTHPVVRTVARPVSPEELNTPVIQDQVKRLLRAAHGIATMGYGMIFGGISLTQFTPDPRLAGVPNLVVVPNLPEFKGEPDTSTPFRKKFIPFRVLANVAFTLGPESTQTIEGCFSLANVCSMPERATTIHDISGLSLHDGIITSPGTDSLFNASSYQHEAGPNGHVNGGLAGDRPGTPRVITERDSASVISIDAYRARRRPEDFADWPEWMSDNLYGSIFGNPAYNLFPTVELRDAFAAGRAEQLARME